MSDIKIIEALNQHLIYPVKQVKKISWICNGYVLNDKQELTHLSIFKSQLKGCIPTELFQLRHLVYLDIRENEIAKLPDDICLLQQLNYLDIRNNQLQNLPEAFSQLQKLEKLYLAQNAFSIVPGQISALAKLDLIDLSDNQITHGCDELLQTGQLRNIYLNNNQLDHFPFDQIINQINELVLIDNPIKEKPDTTKGLISRLIM